MLMQASVWNIVWRTAECSVKKSGNDKCNLGVIIELHPNNALHMYVSQCNAMICLQISLCGEGYDVDDGHDNDADDGHDDDDDGDDDNADDDDDDDDDGLQIILCGEAEI